VVMAVVRATRALGLMVAVITASASAACSSGGPSRSVERHDCVTVGRLTGSPPDDMQRWVRQITSARNSGYELLDAAVHELAAGLRQGNSARIDAAMAKVTRACRSIGLWQTYH
jgi:hypothetical protein